MRCEQSKVYLTTIVQVFFLGRYDDGISLLETNSLWMSWDSWRVLMSTSLGKCEWLDRC